MSACLLMNLNADIVTASLQIKTMALHSSFEAQHTTPPLTAFQCFVSANTACQLTVYLLKDRQPALPFAS